MLRTRLSERSLAETAMRYASTVLCDEAFDLLLHMQQQVTGRVRIGLMVPLKENEPRFAMIDVAIHDPIVVASGAARPTLGESRC